MNPVMGRPSSYTPDIAEKICDLIATTPRGLEFICRNNEGLPSRATVLRWLASNQEFCASYLRARECQADLIFEDCLEIADTQVIGEKVTTSPQGDTIVTADMIEHRKLRIDTRMRMAGKLAPKKYGDKIDVTSDGKAIKGYMVVDPSVEIFKGQ